ncbi:hypothetical protein CDL12_04978 [Handroanthus impetiginosus]|uniref:Uncharacterized protein n=1 Tax=Handroanthus impetiginosus TaxID=429701 RepID=A0A2G9HXS9_9LAMI|nr:hypothetical protein CDL12_04978 [Handroanthus impetiginosus]
MMSNSNHQDIWRQIQDKWDFSTRFIRDGWRQFDRGANCLRLCQELLIQSQ